MAVALQVALGAARAGFRRVRTGARRPVVEQGTAPAPMGAGAGPPLLTWSPELSRSVPTARRPRAARVLEEISPVAAVNP
ncbi:hypothetical protein NKH18_29645 [Streptomyces sp. M10(2022)]